MSNLFASLHLAGNALTTFSRALEVTQNNLVNAATPGYARQTPSLQALAYQPFNGLLGGVEVAAVLSSRQQFIESGVRMNTSLLEYDRQVSRMLDGILPFFGTEELDPPFGLEARFDEWFQAIQQWSASPNEYTVRQSVLDRSTALADAFRDTAAALHGAQAQAQQELEMSVTEANRLLGELQEIQAKLGMSGGLDAGLEAVFYANLEKLSELLDVQATRGPGNQFTVTTSSGAVLLSGDRAWLLTVRHEAPSPDTPFPAGRPAVQVLAGDGADLTESITAGRIKGLLDGLTAIFPALIGGASQQGELNRLAASFADRVNAVLTAAQMTEEDSTPGVPLFRYASDPLSVARTLSIPSDVTASSLALASAGQQGDPYGVPARLLALKTSAAPPDGIQPEGKTYTRFFSDLASQLASMRRHSADAESFHTHLLENARAIRERISGVSVEEEAVALLQWQNAHASIARLIRVLDEMTQTTLELVG